MPPLKLLPFVLLVFLFSCNRSENKKKPQHSFYYWKTTLAFDAAENNEVKKLGVDHFYLHYFDVDWSENLQLPVPKGENFGLYELPRTISEYTPVVFITNRTFERISENWCDSLAVKLSKKISRRTQQIRRDFEIKYLSSKYGYNWYEVGRRSIPEDSLNKMLRINSEIQIDCDWTRSTREKYFLFLKRFKELNPGKIISVTVRLYPYKYAVEMGIPPVDRGMLMCYNLGKVKTPSTKNSVFDLNELKTYMNTGQYPLPLDIVLPAFGWHVWFREGAYKGIVHSTVDLADYRMAFQKVGNTYRFLKDTAIDDNYFREGDELRQEFPDEQELLQAADIVTSKVPGYSRIAFFDWNELSTTKYEKVIQKVFNSH
jgi:hypothetical protein